MMDDRLYVFKSRLRTQRLNGLELCHHTHLCDHIFSLSAPKRTLLWGKTLFLAIHGVGMLILLMSCADDVMSLSNATRETLQ
jgi:hypothetical protein